MSVIVTRRGPSAPVVVGRPAVVVIASRAGPRGAPGAVPTYTHVQSSPLALWVINHNLGFRPAIELFEVGGLRFEAEVIHASANQAVVYLNVPTAGTARCN